MGIAIFDLDGTVLNGDTDGLWGEFLARKGVIDGEEYRRGFEKLLAQYERGELDIDSAYRFLLTQMNVVDRKELNALRNEFAGQVLREKLLPGALREIRRHKECGRYTLMVTATNRYTSLPSARLAGVDELIATDPEEKDGRFTGELIGEANYREGKANKIRTWLNETGRDLSDSWCYGDSNNDIHMMELCENPVAVDPDDKLHKHALEHGWRIISFRK